MSIELIGFNHAQSRLGGIAHRIVNPEMMLWPEIAAIEEEERRIFQRLDGRFVDTGRAERSLTEMSPDAVRAVHGSELEFGTTVEYVRYLTAERTGGHHHGRNEVLISGYEVRETGAGERVLGRIVNR